MVAIAGASDWFDFMSKNMPFTSASASASRSQLEEGGGRISVGGSYRPFGQDILYLLFTTSCIGIHWHCPGCSTPWPLSLSPRQKKAPRGIKMHPSIHEWQFLTTIHVTTTTNTMMKILKEETSISKRVENKTNYKITDNRVGSGELSAMVKVTKKHLHFQINWGSVYKGFFFVKWIWNKN